MTRLARVSASHPNARRAVGRDTLIILAGGALALLWVQLLVPGGLTGTGALDGESPGSSGSSSAPLESTVIIGGGGSTAAPATIPGLPTLGPIVDPSVRLDATPTPVPVITLKPGTTEPSTGGANPTLPPAPTRRPSPTPSPSKTPLPTLTPLHAGFTCSPGGARIESFTDTSTGGPTAWLWMFGDGSESSLRSPSHLYATTGSYTVTLQVSRSGAVDSISHVCTVG